MAGPSALIVLLAQVVGGPAPSSEILAGVRQDFFRQIAESAVARLSNTPSRQVTSGVFAGARVLPLSSGPSLIAQSFVLTQIVGPGFARVVGQVQLVVETETCYLRSAAIIGPAFPLAEWSSDLKRRQALRGPLQLPLTSQRVELSPLRFKVLGHGAATEMARVLHEAAAIHLSGLSNSAPVRSELLAMACAHFAAKAPSALRVHRDLVMDYTQAESVSGAVRAGLALKGGAGRNTATPSPWPLALPKCRLHSSPFAHVVRLELESETSSGVLADGIEREGSLSAQSARPGGDVSPYAEAEMWTPFSCLDWLAVRLTTALTRLTPDAFVVKKRKGRWVELEPGRTAGLLVGQRLVSANGAKLHVIRQIAVSEAPDRVIAFVREESGSQPVAVGDSLQLDPALYPALVNSREGF